MNEPQPPAAASVDQLLTMDEIHVVQAACAEYAQTHDRLPALDEQIRAAGGRIWARYLKSHLQELGLDEMAAKIDPEATPASPADMLLRVTKQPRLSLLTTHWAEDFQAVSSGLMSPAEMKDLEETRKTLKRLLNPRTSDPDQQQDA
jgi:hypothetical protein